MTDSKSWLWRRKPSEKTIALPDKEALSEEINKLLAEKGELERDLKGVNDKLSFALSECNTNEELAKKHAQTAEEALAGWEKAEAKAISLEEELNETLEQKAECEERTNQLEAALKECMQQLRIVREENEKNVDDLLAKAEKDAEENRLVYEEQMAESDQKIAELEGEITSFSEELFLKEELIEELNQQKGKADTDIKDMSLKIDSLQKQNSSLKYEVRVLEKEMEIRNEEKEFNRRTADATHKQHLENVKKIARLESECQKLRVLVRKRLPGPAALTKMRSEVEVLERGPSESRRRTLTYNFPPESPSQKMTNLVEKICTMEEENNVLRENLQKKCNELQISKNMYTRASLKLSEAETQLDEISKSQMIADVTKSALAASDVTASDISLMDDFADMEKMALVCADKPSESSPGINFSISKVMNAIKAIKMTDEDSEYDVRLFKCKASEVASTIQSFLHTCDELLHGKGDVEMFSEKVASTLEWIMNHCNIPNLDSDEMEPPRVSVASNNGYQGAIPLLQIQTGLKDEIQKLESAKKEVEENVEKQKLEIEDLNGQLSAARADMDEAQQKLSSLELELQNRSSHCEHLEAKCLGLESQLHSVTLKNEEEAVEMDQDEMQHKTGWEIVAASEKLAECQESIYNLEKQLKALGPTQDNALSTQVISSAPETPLPPATITVSTPRSASNRTSLLDKMMLAVDDDESPKTKEMICAPEPEKLPPSFNKGALNPAFESDRMRQSFREPGYGSLAIVPLNKQNGHGLFKRLLWRKKKSHIKRLSLPFAA